MKKSRIAVVLLLGILLMAGTACSDVFSGPKPEIVGKSAHGGWSGLDFVVTVECEVFNARDSGNVKVTAIVRTSTGGYWKKSQTVYIYSGATKTVRIVFREIGLFDTYTWSVSAKAK